MCACSQSTRPSRKRTASASWSARPRPRAHAAPGRDARAIAAARHAVARAAQPARRQQARRSPGTTAAKATSTPSDSVSAPTGKASEEQVHDANDAHPHRYAGGADRHGIARRSAPVAAADPGGRIVAGRPCRFTATRRRSSCRSASAKASSSTCPATSRTCWWPIPRSPTRSSARRGAPTSSASRSDRPTSISSTAKAVS